RFSFTSGKPLKRFGLCGIGDTSPRTSSRLVGISDMDGQTLSGQNVYLHCSLPVSAAEQKTGNKRNVLQRVVLWLRDIIFSLLCGDQKPQNSAYSRNEERERERRERERGESSATRGRMKADLTKRAQRALKTYGNLTQRRKAEADKFKR